MNLKKIICEEQNGMRIEFAYDGFPFRLAGTDGFSLADYTVNTLKSGQDGENYNGASANKRNLVITLEIYSDYANQRNKLYSFFQPRAVGIIYYYDDTVKKANYYVEKIDIGESGVIRPVTISLICPDPKWYSISDNVTSFAYEKGEIKWPLNFKNPFMASQKIKTAIKTIYNPSGVTQGLTATMRATGTVSNPYLYDINRQKMMRICVTMHAGDIVTITTGSGNKHVRMLSGHKILNINNLMQYPPAWLQIYPGDNVIKYGADSGTDALDVTVSYTQAYWGV